MNPGVLLRKPKVVVVGSMNMDLSVRVGRLPRPGETVSGGDLERGAGGKGANQAVAAQLLGARTALIGRIGADEFGGELRGALRRAGVDDSAVTVDDGASGSALVLVDSAGENMITVSPGANGTFVPSGLDQHADRIASADALLLQLEVPTATCLAAARTARAAQVLVVLNAAPLPPDIGPELVELIACADILVVNEGEAVSLLDAVSGCSSASRWLSRWRCAHSDRRRSSSPSAREAPFTPMPTAAARLFRPSRSTRSMLSERAMCSARR